jgi:hypothetical protein
MKLDRIWLTQALASAHRLPQFMKFLSSHFQSVLFGRITWFDRDFVNIHYKPIELCLIERDTIEIAIVFRAKLRVEEAVLREFHREPLRWPPTQPRLNRVRPRLPWSRQTHFQEAGLVRSE